MIGACVLGSVEATTAWEGGKIESKLLGAREVSARRRSNPIIMVCGRFITLSWNLRIEKMLLSIPRDARYSGMGSTPIYLKSATRRGIVLLLHRVREKVLHPFSEYTRNFRADTSRMALIPPEHVFGGVAHFRVSSATIAGCCTVVLSRG